MFHRRHTAAGNGFLPGKGTIAAIVAVKTILIKCINGRENLYIAFMDFTKTCDQVNYVKLLTILHEPGLKGNCSRALSEIGGKCNHLTEETRCNIRCPSKQESCQDAFCRSLCSTHMQTM